MWFWVACLQNVVQIYSFNLTKEPYFIVIEFVDGKSLHEELALNGPPARPLMLHVSVILKPYTLKPLNPKILNPKTLNPKTLKPYFIVIEFIDGKSLHEELALNGPPARPLMLHVRVTLKA